MTDLTARSHRVADSLRHAGLAIITLPESAATAPLAASALGTEVGAIANSLVFMADGAPLLVMTSGAHRVDTALLAERLGKERIVRAKPEQVLEATGQVIGGVAPSATPHTVFALTFAELVSLTGGTVLAVN